MDYYDRYIEQLREMAIPIAELMANSNGLNPKHADHFKSADVVYGLDVGRPFGRDAVMIFHGRAYVEKIAQSDKGRTAMVIVVAYDQRTDQLEALAACCEHHRGGCDYQGTPAGILDGGHTFAAVWAANHEYDDAQAKRRAMLRRSLPKLPN